MVLHHASIFTLILKFPFPIANPIQIYFEEFIRQFIFCCASLLIDFRYAQITKAHN
jgi:hypothetical protein